MADRNNPAENIPILVTGAHRTGTTWVGKMLCAGGQAAYISEPLNKLHRPGILRAPTAYWYPYLCEENGEAFLASLQAVSRFRYHWLAGLGGLRSAKDLLRLGRDVGVYGLGQLRRQRPLLKDPFAVFSIPWFIENLGCQVVVTVRHPAAFASSLKRLDWPFDFDDFLAQPLLMRDWLEPFRQEMLAQINRPPDILAQASLTWRMVYTVVHTVQQRYPQVKVAIHEDLSLDPLEGFQALYDLLGLDFSERARTFILSSSSSDNPKERAHRKVYTTRLDSRANLENWKRRLSPEEINLVRELTEPVAQHYYPEVAWE